MVPGLATIMQEKRAGRPCLFAGVGLIGPAPWHIGCCIRQETRLGFLHDEVARREGRCCACATLPLRYVFVVASLLFRCAARWSDELEQGDRMRKDQIEQLADAVADRLNGSLSGLRKDVAEIKNRLGTVEEIVSSNASKIEDLHGWMGSINGRITDLETADQ